MAVLVHRSGVVAHASLTNKVCCVAHNYSYSLSRGLIVYVVMGLKGLWEVCVCVRLRSGREAEGKRRETVIVVVIVIITQGRLREGLTPGL